jgi:hypothetical protein
LFADDTSLGYASQDEDQIKYVINHDLHELGDCPRPHMHTQILVEYKLSIISLNFFYLIYISIYAKHICV